jgi:hypothetical protein
MNSRSPAGLTWKSERSTKGSFRDRKPISRLLDEEMHTAATKNGELYFFDRDVVTALGETSE